ncbi:MAG: hypothetical protein K8I29_19595 [Alphaproteobacteria bacterium]|uniref:Uncharacterized protein n=1 Tax=Candidatus Nitrobium versatile TaxID=2884831 RepID=A0A953M3V0_9BACT|nr:hypothetical protein [Candidatus Nitrobium versatile]
MTFFEITAILLFMSLFKKKTYRSERFLEFTRRQSCLIRKTPSPDPHHLFTGGMGIKCCDLYSIPLDRLVHDELHTIGRGSFENRHGIDLTRELLIHMARYICLLEGNDPDEYDWGVKKQ